jgi:hypothetical protein
MKLAILFWFYKEPQICKNRLQLLRRYNPNTPIYGLYGGDIKDIDTYKSVLSEYLDDFYAFTQNKDSNWKWLLGDLLITDWYSQRGQSLSWDTIVIVQWDMLVFGAVDQIFSMLVQDQILLSGLVPIKEVEEEWSWTSSKKPERRKLYLEFLDYVRNKYLYNREPFCCGFIVVCLPRKFMEKYSEIEQPELGFLEYKVPIYAQIFEVPFCTNHPFQLTWKDPSSAKNRKILNAERYDINLTTMVQSLIDSKGARIFHPYRKIFPTSKKQGLYIFLILFQEIKEWLIDSAKRIRYGGK